MASVTAAARPNPDAQLPTERGGWWHHYVCPAHGVELVHEALLTGRFPERGARCRYGCLVDSADVRGAWYVLSHQAWARRIRLLAHTGRRAEALALLTAYTADYLALAGAGEHEQAQRWMLRGRLFHQALTEAIWAVSIGHAVTTLAYGGTRDLAPLLPLLDALTDAAASARSALVEADRFTSNYTAWLNAAGAVTSRAVALVRGETRQDGWLDGEHGLFTHLLAATGADGWEWEASTYYHGFVLRAALLALRGHDPVAIPAAVRERLRAMIGALAGIATDGGVLPALHDGPYLRPPLALEWLELAALADQFTEHAGLAEVAALAREQAQAMDDGLDRLLDNWFSGPPLPAVVTTRDTVTRYPDAGYTVLRAPGVHALLDHGPHGGSHGHLDKLALYLYGRTTTWQPDPGQVPYGHEPLRAHYADTTAHPAFSVDGLSQRACAGRLMHAAGDHVLVAADDCYPGVLARRAVLVHGDYLVDVLALAADRPRALTVHMRPGCALELQVDGGTLRSVWHGQETLHGGHVCTVAASPWVRPGRGPADDPQRARTWVDWTATAERALFCSVYRRGAPVPAISAREQDSGVLIDVCGETLRLDLEVDDAQ